VSHTPDGRLPLLSARSAVTIATLKRAATSIRTSSTVLRYGNVMCDVLGNVLEAKTKRYSQFPCLVNRGTMGVNSLPKTASRLRLEPRPFCAWVQQANHWATVWNVEKPRIMYGPGCPGSSQAKGPYWGGAFLGQVWIIWNIRSESKLFLLGYSSDASCRCQYCSNLFTNTVLTRLTYSLTLTLSYSQNSNVDITQNIISFRYHMGFFSWML